MQTKDFDGFQKTVSAVYDLYGKQASSFAISLWWNSLKGYELSDIQNALSRHINNPDNGQFLPKPADVVRMFGGTNQDKAMLAWSKVDNAVRQVGTYSDIVFDDPIIHAVIDDMGGWIRLGQKNEDEWPFIAKEFENRYRGYSMRNETPVYRLVLTGIANMHNARHGFRLCPPVLFGDEEKARLVMEQKQEQKIPFKRIERLSA